MVYHPCYPNELHLAKIKYFAQIAILPEHDSVRSILIACVHFHFQHQCNVWFSGPTQVWAAALENVYFVPLYFIKYRVALCFTEVGFGGVIGIEKVIVVSPLT